MNANTNTSRCMAEMNSVLEVAQPQFSPTPIKNKRKRISPKWSWHCHALNRMRDRLMGDRRQLIAETSEAVAT